MRTGPTRAIGRSTQLAKQTGEYLAAAELCRRGLISATFSGNVPDYDIIAVGPRGQLAIQVKAIRRGDWQLRATDFVFITLQEKKQVLGECKSEPYPGLICIFIRLGLCYGKDEFFVLEWKKLQKLLVENYRSWLKAHNYVRPRNPASFHTSISPSQLQDYASWEPVERWLSEPLEELARSIGKAKS